ncbi:MAG: glutathione ABC transporter substrate-binding protein, partial [Cetobacterium sp.]
MKQKFKNLMFVLMSVVVFFGYTSKLLAAKETIVIAQGADAKSLDPHSTNDQPSSRVSAQIYDRLVEQDTDMNVIPGLAEKWEQIDDVTTVFHLREGVKFHNG